MADLDHVDDHVVVVVTQMLTKLVRAAYAILVVVLGFSIGGAAWVTQTNFRLEIIEIVLEKLGKSLPPEWLLEDIAEIRVEQKSLQVQIDRLEGHNGEHYVRPE
jgi:hypothetical protein